MEMVMITEQTRGLLKPTMHARKQAVCELDVLHNTNTKKKKEEEQQEEEDELSPPSIWLFTV